MMRRPIAALALAPLMGLWLMSNSGLFLAVPPCPMHGVGGAHASMSTPAHAAHSLGGSHHHGSKSADQHGCDCAGRCGHLPQQFALFDLVTFTSVVASFTSVQASHPQSRVPSGVRHLPFATGPPPGLFV